ncbi:hypothetical protein [Streptomyces sp. NPDC048734]|uniref:hypothetical protein n=1 Tax=Streptomyces sp. NPDC048734 TaxID=3365590 RepID=UPI003722CD62
MPHRNAPLTETGRLRLARCVVEDGWTLRRPARAALVTWYGEDVGGRFPGIRTADPELRVMDRAHRPVPRPGRFTRWKRSAGGGKDGP